MCYGVKCWAMQTADIKRMRTTKMIIILIMCGKTPIAIRFLREWTDVNDTDEQLRARPLKTLRHLERVNVGRLIRRIREKTIVENVRRGRPKKTGEETVKDGMKRRNLTLEDA